MYTPNVSIFFKKELYEDFLTKTGILKNVCKNQLQIFLNDYWKKIDFFKDFFIAKHSTFLIYIFKGLWMDLIIIVTFLVKKSMFFMGCLLKFIGILRIFLQGVHDQKLPNFWNQKLWFFTNHFNIFYKIFSRAKTHNFVRKF